MPSSDRFDARLLKATLSLVALAPLPLASNRPLPAALLSLGAALLLAVWALRLGLTGKGISIPPARLAWSLALFGLVCLWIVVQWLPIVPADLADPIWSVAGHTLGTDLPGRISVNPNETLSGLMRLLAYAAIFWLTLQLTRNAARAQLAVTWIAVFGTIYAFYGLVAYLAGNEWLLIYRKWAYWESLTGTFVNRNSFAAFLGLCLICAFSKLLDRISPTLAIKRPFRQKLVVVIETLTLRAALPLAAVVTLALALVLTSSRGGVMVSCAALLVLLVIYARGRSLKWRHVGAVGALTLAIAGVALATSGGPLSKRYAEQSAALSESGRAAVYGIVADAIMSSPWTGTGFGTFPDVFPAYRNADGLPQVTWDKAHNTYLENALELGVPAAVLLNLSLLLLVLQTARGVRNRRRGWTIPAIGVSASVLLGLHSLVDFSLQMPAIAALYACIMGMAVSQSWSQDEDL